MTITQTGVSIPIVKNELGDTLQYTLPIIDTSAYTKNEIIIKFRQNALNLEKLCFDYQIPLMVDGGIEMVNIYKSQMMMQQFPIDTLITNPLLKSTLHQLGGLYFERITVASPCSDTLTITRYGDTIKCDNYLWMTLKLNNDTSVINSCLMLTILFQEQLDIAEPNYYGYLNVKPNDQYYENDQNKKQISLWPSYTNCERAWDFQTGSQKIKVGIIDNGINYTHCDLGYTFGNKVVDGWNYVTQSSNFSNNSVHGTQVSGIIGAYTNGVYNGCNNTGIAGIAGGWLGNNNGCSLVGLKVDINDQEEDKIILNRTLGAILDAASDYVTPHENIIKRSFAVYVFNCSWGYEYYSESLRNAFNYAFENGVSIVSSRGNVVSGNPKEWYPANFEPSWIFSVGGLSMEHTLISDSWYGNNMDILAPAYAPDIYTTSLNSYSHIGQTSAAAAHVSGAIALLRSEFLENSKYQYIKPEPEDYENIIKAAATDLNYNPDNQDTYLRTYNGYDNVSGWGELKIGNIFEMLNNGFSLYHEKITDIEEPEEFSGPMEEIRFVTRINEISIEKLYKAKKREITGSKVLEGYDNMQLYVWGRSGRSENNNKGGYSAANPLYKNTKYTEVTSGQGGNGIVNGVYHNHLTVTAKTYQYALYDFKTEQFVRYEPAEETEIELFVSVFGKKVPLSTKNNEEKSIIDIYPNPVLNNTIIKFKSNDIIPPTINICNNLGVILNKYTLNKSNDANYETVINTDHYSSGIYYISVITSNKIYTQKIMVIK
ncbi:MAG TPA: S8 family serine peptidase [Candidatus Kapabacteria bacterium]|nr:S8 family serine peptidase [Candidatus Kapabacteria bacterium]